jgi:hypothetical protein
MVVIGTIRRLISEGLESTSFGKFITPIIVVAGIGMISFIQRKEKPKNTKRL